MRSLGIFIFILFLSFPASAQTVCGIHDAVAKKLNDGFNEQPTSGGLSNNGGMLEVYTSPDGSWTIVLTRPDGLSCLMATGEHWETYERMDVES